MLPIYLESTPKRTFASAIAWPGWARSGRDEATAVQALFDSAQRYAEVVQRAGIEFPTLLTPADFEIVERLEGKGGTEFGVLEAPPGVDALPVDEVELSRLQGLLEAYWQAFDAAVASAHGRELRKGPRGGGRDIDKIVEHVVGADLAYLGQIAWQGKRPKGQNPHDLLVPTREEVRAALVAAARGETPTQRPRGGAVWSPRYFVRRCGWHVLDHTWEIEDRLGLAL
jgi:hypothetical protein